MIPFEFEADRGFFTQLLCREGETLDDYAELFDFDPPAAKQSAPYKRRVIKPATWGPERHVKVFGQLTRADQQSCH